MVVYIQNFKQAGSVYFSRERCSAYFAINSKSSAGNILQFELYPPLPTCNIVIIVE